MTELSNIPKCPVTKLEMDLELVMIALQLFPQVDQEKMHESFIELSNRLKETKCICV